MALVTMPPPPPPLLETKLQPYEMDSSLQTALSSKNVEDGIAASL